MGLAKGGYRIVAAWLDLLLGEHVVANMTLDNSLSYHGACDRQKSARSKMVLIEGQVLGDSTM